MGEELVDEAQRPLGRSILRRRWNQLGEATRSDLKRSPEFEHVDLSPDDDAMPAEWYETHIGRLESANRIPSPPDKGKWSISAPYAYEVSESCEAVLSKMSGDPQLVSLAIRAYANVRFIEVSTRVTQAKAERATRRPGPVGLVFRFAVIMLAPAWLAGVAISAASDAPGSAIFCAYALAFSLNVAWGLHKANTDILYGCSSAVVEHVIWGRIKSVAFGTGATTTRDLEMMRGRGISVPDVLFDLCLCLSRR